jgi:protein gp37
MGKDSSIEWTRHTFNPWWGCFKISPACKYCYAMPWAKRTGHAIWGETAPRRFFGDNHWNEPRKWNKAAMIAETNERVFCASMADVFEDRPDLWVPRLRLWHLIEITPYLDWLLLTKRPENIQGMVPWRDNWPNNVWIGTTVESQDYAEKRLPYLTSLPAKVRFISCEPLLGPIDLAPWLNPNSEGVPYSVDWVIGGGESGPKSRPSHPDWFRALRDQCKEHGAAFHFKQWGQWAPLEGGKQPKHKVILMRDRTGNSTPMESVGKKKAGRLLDGIEWNGLPLPF